VEGDGNQWLNVVCWRRSQGGSDVVVHLIARPESESRMEGRKDKNVAYLRSFLTVLLSTGEAEHGVEILQ